MTPLRTYLVGTTSVVVLATSSFLLAGSAPAVADGTADTPQTVMLNLLDATTVGEARHQLAAGGSAGALDAVATALTDLPADLPLATATEGGVSSLMEGPNALVLDALRSVLDPTQYQCEPTALSDYTTAALLGPWFEADPSDEGYLDAMGGIVALAIVGAFDAPTYDLITHANDPRFSRFGTGAINETPDISRSFFDLKNFWDINGKTIRLEPLKSTVVSSPTDADVTRFGQAVLVRLTNQPADAAQGLELGQQMHLIIDQYVPWLGGDNPIYTLNAFALDPASEPPIFRTFGKLLTYGDGLLQAQSDLGLLDVGPEAVLGHEYGHHLQFVNRAFTDEASPEATRRIELMADAYSGYFAAHEEGQALTTRRLGEVVRMFEEVGDCGFTALAHHGTPLQRQRAGIFGVELAQTSDCVTSHARRLKVGTSAARCRYGTARILKSRKIQGLFDAALPEMVVPDA